MYSPVPSQRRNSLVLINAVVFQAFRLIGPVAVFKVELIPVYEAAELRPMMPPKNVPVVQSAKEDDA